MVHHVRRTILNRSAMKASGAPYAWFYWWACLDSNQEPDRYERPALTIELQAPPQGCRECGQATVPTPLTLRPAIRQCRVASLCRERGRAHRFRLSVHRNAGELDYLAPFL